jgi:hypothetical protein
LAENRRLPCPARLDSEYDTDPDYGQEVRTLLGECEDTISGFNLQGDSTTEGLGIVDQQSGDSVNDMKILYGMVPTKELSLSKKDVEDAYGNKFSYVIVKEFGNEFESYAGSERIGDLISDWNYINIIDKSFGSDVEITNKAIMLLISHGEKDDGAFRNSGGNPLPSSSDHEGDNSYKTSPGDKYDRNFNIDSSQASFDDFIIFKTKDQLIRDAELEFIKCSGEQGLIKKGGSNSCVNVADAVFGDSSYGQIVDVDQTAITLNNCGCTVNNLNNVIQRTCGKYGKWTDIYCNEQYQIQYIDEVKSNDASGLQLLDDSGNGIVIKNEGSVGIGTTPPTSDFKLSVAGSAYSNEWVSFSDENLKTDNPATINPASTLAKILDLNPVNYQWKIEDNPSLNLPEGNQIGFIAQEVEAVFPDLVSIISVSIPSEESGNITQEYKSISYDKVTPLLVAAIQELNTKITTLEGDIVTLENRITALENATPGNGGGGGGGNGNGGGGGNGNGRGGR